MLLLVASVATGQSFNGFDVSNATIPPEEILSGGPPRDGIPSIDDPIFISPAAADYMLDADEVVSVTIGKETRAYPLRILVWHEIVNDRVGGKPIVITYCPLCGTAMVFSRSADGRTLDFGVSGLLYQSDVLMYDRQTDSLWSQLAMQAVSGPLVGSPLVWLPSEQLTWAAWKKKNPEGQVLSTETGFPRNYSTEAYTRYHQSPNTMFPVPVHRTELSQKERILGVLLGGKPRAYPFKILSERRVIIDAEIKITYDPDTGLAEVKLRETGEILPVVKVYWFAWQAFYPDTELWRPEP